MIEIKQKVNECCKYCLYYSTLNGIPHCGNANNNSNIKTKVIVSPSTTKCFYFFLDHKYR